MLTVFLRAGQIQTVLLHEEPVLAQEEGQGLTAQILRDVRVLRDVRASDDGPRRAKEPWGS